MAYHDQFAHTPDKRSGKGSSPSRSGDDEKQKTPTKKELAQDTDKNYGAGRFSQRTPQTAHGKLSHGEHKNA